jgi:predicted permease
MLYRNAGFTGVAVFALALGIGVNTTVFTAYKAMVARPLDARDAGEMVNLALVRDSGAAAFTFSYPDYKAYRDGVRAFSGLIAVSLERMRISSGADVVGQRASRSNAKNAIVFVVSENYFKVLGITALRGRTFDSISVPELIASPSVLMSENYWQRRFAGDPAVLGKTFDLNGAAFTVIGITPHDFAGTEIGPPDFWLPVSIEPLAHADENWLGDRENERYRLFGRLAPGIGIAQAQAETTALADRLRGLHDPRSDAAKPATVIVWPGSPFPLPLKLLRGLTLTIALIMAAAGMVLVVACANVGSLQLARARSRQAELHTRLSLGASRLRIIRQLLTESALLALLAGALALLFTSALLKVCVNLAAEAIIPPEDGTLVFNVTPDLQIFVFVFAISLMAGLLFGLAPAMESSRSALTSGTRGSTAPVGSRRIQDFLIAAQVALSLVLMIAGSMLIRSARNALRMETGYESKRVVDLDFQFPEAPKYTAARKDALLEELRRRLAVLPGVAAITSARAPDENSFRTAALPLAEKASAHNVQSILHYTYVQPNYFQTLGIPLLLGRGFQPQAGEAGYSIILSESAARQMWPGRDPIGRNLRIGPIDERVHDGRELVADGAAYQVIGVARDTRGVEFDGSDSKQIYLPLPEKRIAAHPILIRTGANPAPLLKVFDATIASIDPEVTATSRTLDAMLRRSAPFIASSLAAGVASAIGLLGLLLASMGIYGTVSYIVVLRTREIGIRMAVGAQKRDILGLVLRESARPVVVGLAAGMFLAIGDSYLLRGILYGLKSVDSISFACMSLLFLVIALLATYPPSRRALRVDPVVALRHE